MAAPLTPDAAARALAQLRALASSAPDFGKRGQLDPDTQLWLARANGLIDAVLGTLAAQHFQVFNQNLMGLREQNAHALMALFYRALARAEELAPPAQNGAFIAVGNEFDFTAQIATLLRPARSDIFIIDPYADASALTDVAVFAAEGVSVRVLGDARNAQANLKPAVASWRAQHAKARPLEARLTRSGALHDRLFVIDGVAWDVSQSIKDFSGRSPGSVQRCETQIGSAKIQYYEELWAAPDTRSIA